MTQAPAEQAAVHAAEQREPAEHQGGDAGDKPEVDQGISLDAHWLPVVRQDEGDHGGADEDAGAPRVFDPAIVARAYAPSDAVDVSMGQVVNEHGYEDDAQDHRCEQRVTLGERERPEQPALGRAERKDW